MRHDCCQVSRSRRTQDAECRAPASLCTQMFVDFGEISSAVIMKVCILQPCLRFGAAAGPFGDVEDGGTAGKPAPISAAAVDAARGDALQPARR